MNDCASLRRSGRTLALLLSVALVPTVSIAADDSPTTNGARLASRALLLDVAHAGARCVAVGEYGVVIVSDDDGVTWRHVPFAPASMLTAVSFADDKEGWAVGHAGTVLHTIDGGDSWTTSTTPAEATDSFLDVLAAGHGRALAVGAYGLYLETTDAGKTWERRQPIDEDLHLNRLSRSKSGTLCLAGEAGLLALSRDDGRTWRRLESPYDGSFYGLIELVSRRLLAHGLRGHVYASDDDGLTWSPIPVDREVLIMAGVETKLGTVALVGLGGVGFVSHNDAATFEAFELPGLKAAAEVLPLPDQTLLVAGDGGVRRMPLPDGGAP